MDNVNHAIFVKKVVAGDGFMKWVGAVPNVHTSYVVGDSTDNRERVLDRQHCCWSEIASDLDTRVGGFGKQLLALV